MQKNCFYLLLKTALEMRETETKQRSLPQTPVTLIERQQRFHREPSPLPRRSVSSDAAALEEQDSYTDLTESSENLQVEQRATCSCRWREAIDDADVNELRTLVSQLVTTLENGLRPPEHTHDYEWSGNGFDFYIDVDIILCKS